MSGRDGSVQSVDRAVSVLQVIARHGEQGVTEIAADLTLHKSTVSRLLGTLEARGLVEQASHRGRFRLGHGIVQLAEGVTRKSDVHLISRPVCIALAEEVGETVNLAVHEDRAVVTIDQVIGSSQITTVDWVGRQTAMHSTSAGKVFLAHLAEEELQTYLHDLEPLTPATVVDPDAMRAELRAVRADGYARTVDEQEVGLSAVSAPIRTLDGTVVAALVVSGPTFRINPTTIPGIAETLLRSAAEISERNGYPKPG